MKNLIIVLLLVLNTSCFSQEKTDEKCIKVTIERVDPAKVKVTKNNTCTDVVEDGFMTKDLAILVGMNQSWMETKEFIKKISEKLNELMKNN